MPLWLTDIDDLVLMLVHPKFHTCRVIGTSTVSVPLTTCSVAL